MDKASKPHVQTINQRKKKDFVPIRKFRMNNGVEQSTISSVPTSVTPNNLKI